MNDLNEKKKPNGIVAAAACDDLCLEVAAAPAKANHARLGVLLGGQWQPANTLSP